MSLPPDTLLKSLKPTERARLFHTGERKLFFITDHGRVITVTSRGLERELKLIEAGDGRYRVCVNGTKWLKVHHLVLKAFVGPRPEGLIGCHNDGNNTNNRPENLRWDTYRNNTLDMIKHGTMVRVSGADHPSAHLNADQPAEIRQRYAAGESIASIARDLGVGTAVIQGAVFNMTYVDHNYTPPVREKRKGNYKRKVTRAMELEIQEHAAHGERRQAIADHFGISISTVDRYIFA